MRLKELRKNCNLTQSELASKLNIPLMTYNNYENNKSKPSIETLIKIANFHNVSIDYIVERNFGNDLGYLTKSQYDNIRLILNLNESNQNKVFGYALGLLENQ